MTAGRRLSERLASPRTFLAIAALAAVVVVGLAVAAVGSAAVVGGSDGVAAHGDEHAGTAAAMSSDHVGIIQDVGSEGVIDTPTYEPDPPTDEGTATVMSNDEGGEHDVREAHDTIAGALDAAGPGDTVELSGAFEPEGTLVVDSPGVTVRAAEPHGARVDGGGEETVLAVTAPNVTVEGLWIADGGENLENEDAGVFLGGEADGATLKGLYLTDVAFGVWVNGADDVTVRDSRIEGIDAPRFADRGNGIHLWEVDGAELRGNEITGTRDGIYYSWAEEVDAVENTMWDLRYGVHYMYSNDNRLADNVAVGNDVGYALMVSERIEVVDNVAVDNRGGSGHGILLKEIDHSTVRGNDLVANDRGVFLYNAQDNELTDNLIYANGVGVHHTAGTANTHVEGNSFVRNDEQVLTMTRELVAWNGAERGNYWSDANAPDVDGDGVSETRHRPAGAAERLVQETPGAAAFADSPAFDAIRLVETRFPLVETAGIVDRRPLAEPAHDPEPYRPYAAAADPTVEYDDDPGDDHHH